MKIVKPLTAWTGSLGIAPDGTLLRGINPFGGTWGIEGGKMSIAGNNPFASIYVNPDGRIRFVPTLRNSQ